MRTSEMCYTFQKEKKTPSFGVEEKGKARKGRPDPDSFYQEFEN